MRMFRPTQPTPDKVEGKDEVVSIPSPVRLNKRGRRDVFDFRPQIVTDEYDDDDDEGDDPKDFAALEPVPSSISETTDGTSDNQEPNASAEKGSSTETEQLKQEEVLSIPEPTPAPTSTKKTSAGKTERPAKA